MDPRSGWLAIALPPGHAHSLRSRPCVPRMDSEYTVQNSGLCPVHRGFIAMSGSPHKVTRRRSTCQSRNQRTFGCLKSEFVPIEDLVLLLLGALGALQAADQKHRHGHRDNDRQDRSTAREPMKQAMHGARSCPELRPEWGLAANLPPLRIPILTHPAHRWFVACNIAQFILANRGI